MSSSAQDASGRRSSSTRSVNRRVGYVIAVVVNLVLIWLLTVWPTWEAVPFLTDDTRQVLLPVTISLTVGAAVNLVYFIFDRAWLRAVGEIIASAVALIAVLRIWEVFPFDFTDPNVPWDLIVRVILGFAIAGCIVSIIVQLVILVRLLGKGTSARR